MGNKMKVIPLFIYEDYTAALCQFFCYLVKEIS
jgi:hypothetical protein